MSNSGSSDTVCKYSFIRHSPWHQHCLPAPHIAFKELPCFLLPSVNLHLLFWTLRSLRARIALLCWCVSPLSTVDLPHSRCLTTMCWRNELYWVRGGMIMRWSYNMQSKESFSDNWFNMLNCLRWIHVDKKIKMFQWSMSTWQTIPTFNG